MADDGSFGMLLSPRRTQARNELRIFVGVATRCIDCEIGMLSRAKSALVPKNFRGLEKSCVMFPEAGALSMR